MCLVRLGVGATTVNVRFDYRRRSGVLTVVSGSLGKK